MKKPYYEIVFLKEKPILISVYYYKYKKGKEAQKPKNVRILFGKYDKEADKSFNNPKHFAKNKYSQKEKIKRACQLIVDFFFKYLRTNKRR